MDENQNTFYKRQAEGIIKKLALRKMEGYYCTTVGEARQKLLDLMGKEVKDVSYGGSMTLEQNGFKDAVREAGHNLIVREDYRTSEELKNLKSLQINSDFFLTSTNAITLDGELVNIDNRGNRLCFLMYGPENVIIIAGMNKVVTDVEDGIKRIRNLASPPNCLRLGRNTPCAVTGRCTECYSESICCQTVVTRLSAVPGRIKVILVGEVLGY